MRSVGRCDPTSLWTPDPGGDLSADNPGAGEAATPPAAAESRVPPADSAARCPEGPLPSRRGHTPSPSPRDARYIGAGAPRPQRVLSGTQAHGRGTRLSGRGSRHYGAVGIPSIAGKDLRGARVLGRSFPP